MASGYRQFDVVTDHSDHYFAKVKAAGCFANARSKVHRRIMQDWKILEESLPETIYVRAYEGRIDLLRAVIIGAQGTPYHDGLFFFDIAFPEDYPNSPVKVRYNSYGLRVNPNLYENGTVCLSLLNTWDGQSKCERWNAKSSTVLQVLVSIQALVLNAEPYYNEPGFKPAPNSKAYNEIVFALSCKTMHLTLRNPPKHAKEFVKAHFRRRGYHILKSIVAYRNGSALVGYYYDPGNQGTSKVSRSLVKDLNELHELLYADFSKIKAPLIDKLKPPLTDSDSAPNGMIIFRFFGYIWNILKKVFGIGDKKSSSSSNTA